MVVRAPVRRLAAIGVLATLAVAGAVLWCFRPVPLGNLERCATCDFQVARINQGAHSYGDIDWPLSRAAREALFPHLGAYPVLLDAFADLDGTGLAFFYFAETNLLLDRCGRAGALTRAEAFNAPQRRARTLVCTFSTGEQTTGRTMGRHSCACPVPPIVRGRVAECGVHAHASVDLAWQDDPATIVPGVPVCAHPPELQCRAQPKRFTLAAYTHLTLDDGSHTGRAGAHACPRARFDERGPQLVKLFEWIEYYRLLGVEHFFIAYYDDARDGPTSRALAEYVAEGLVTLRWYPMPEYCARFSSPQFAAENSAWRRFARVADWLLYTDIDEFVTSNASARPGSLRRLVESRAACQVIDIGQADIRVPCNGTAQTLAQVLQMERALCVVPGANPNPGKMLVRLRGLPADIESNVHFMRNGTTRWPGCAVPLQLAHFREDRDMYVGGPVPHMVFSNARIRRKVVLERHHEWPLRLGTVRNDAVPGLHGVRVDPSLQWAVRHIKPAVLRRLAAACRTWLNTTVDGFLRTFIEINAPSSYLGWGRTGGRSKRAMRSSCTHSFLPVDATGLVVTALHRIHGGLISGMRFRNLDVRSMA